MRSRRSMNLVSSQIWRRRRSKWRYFNQWWEQRMSIWQESRRHSLSPSRLRNGLKSKGLRNKRSSILRSFQYLTKTMCLFAHHTRVMTRSASKRHQNTCSQSRSYLRLNLNTKTYWQATKTPRRPSWSQTILTYSTCLTSKIRIAPRDKTKNSHQKYLSKRKVSTTFSKTWRKQTPTQTQEAAKHSSIKSKAARSPFQLVSARLRDQHWVSNRWRWLLIKIRANKSTLRKHFLNALILTTTKRC